MSGNYSQYDPSSMFKEWIQKSGRAQAEFIKNFGSLMNNQGSQTFDPLETLKSMSDVTRNTQSNMMENMTNLQNKSMDTMFNIGQMLPSFMNWGAYKTTVGSAGRISIPEAERNALGLGEGDLVQVIILPIGKKSGNKEVKQ
ncbi:MAG: AbrB/MazE/SpoVT family DNA-binding domain-containing protein [Nitrosopumilaceae archaeon]|jgi:AbrB family looped-hinge helix DNA binding protein|uniref:AbrB/MazE/SpoVT family DNA-binding domain-containing protein n=4 Tax=Candidatus Nitrosomaritimum aestuariumsis TaxID=3342354 RepID=A0AC60W5G6_9ARCH|nr:AbrB/MazE/SpoVT family DNA-binding domain-containing protein [Nitrosopumilaceae archaeon]MBA4454936.1 AbrB/MazE/SpoVT family DNA-binding domain-containing protein [Nitrosopumilaceae archaeon]MBA4460282.1 AbrB/MazE/SpoVT family DNA-binding domain-containing protein [Nitrosopumilaceae archaeon]MBA4461237.1 AbrB/MazE/SpoVT family DNA-binding domain-containing protein [Nitrosopumilaceae archaeon]MBA4463913.1 AbrB/MazE/SpoVT family DNA-binding domain-containing protein [Nitrosopumilaceae archaeon